MRSSRSVFGKVPEQRPDMLTDAETVLLPWLKLRGGSPGEETQPYARTGDRTPSGPLATIRARGLQAVTVSRLVLLVILILQAILSLRLRNTAFEDEATYLYAGHMELQHLLHGAALQGQYASYFSGSPVLYPVAAA